MHHHGGEICERFLRPPTLFYLLLELGIHLYCGAIELGVLNRQSNLLPQGLEKLRLLGIKSVSSRAHQCERPATLFPA